MVHVTEQAIEMLDAMRTDALNQVGDLPEGTPEPGLRLVVEQNQGGMILDLPQEQDQIVEREGHPVLLVDPNVSSMLDGATIDVTETPEGTRLTIESETLEQ